MPDLQNLAVTCLEQLAGLATAHGQVVRAARLLDAVAFLRSDECEFVEEAPLTRREWQVARLVARGHSNRQIARELVVSDRTVDTHVSHIFRKLGVSSRAQIAAWFVTATRPLTLLA
jgi:DNA-binding NarL/FixJ family response regulator